MLLMYSAHLVMLVCFLHGNLGGYFLHPLRDVSLDGCHLGDVRLQDPERPERASSQRRLAQVLCPHVLQSAR